MTTNKREKYTVLLLRPDYLTNNYGPDTYIAHVSAANVKGAIKQAWKQVCKADDVIAEHVLYYYVIAVFRGHLIDLSGVEP